MRPDQLETLMLRLKATKADIARQATVSTDHFIRISNGRTCSSTAAMKISRAIAEMDTRKVAPMTIADRLFEFRRLAPHEDFPQE